MADPQLAADDAGPDPRRCHLDDLEADVVRQRAPIDEDAAQLVDSALACAGKSVKLTADCFNPNAHVPCPTHMLKFDSNLTLCWPRKREKLQLTASALACGCRCS
jgi:hypothetical protein